MSNGIKKGIIRALIYGVVVVVAVSVLSYLGVGCVHFLCGSCFAESSYDGWRSGGIHIGIFLGVIVAIYGFVTGLSEGIADSRRVKENLLREQRERQNEWITKFNNMVANIVNLLQTGQNADSAVKECLHHCDEESWMDEKFFSEEVKQAKNILKYKVFAINQININKDGELELKKVINILNARNAIQPDKSYNENVKDINSLLEYMANPSNIIDMDPYGKLLPSFEDNLKKYEQTKDLYEQLLEQESKIFENALENVDIFKKELLEKIEVCMYQVVREKPYNADKFNKIQAFYGFFKNKYFYQNKYDNKNMITIKAPDSLYNELYTYKSMGESVINSKKAYIMEQVNSRLDLQVLEETTLNIAASLKNLGLFDLEKEILIDYVGRGLKVNDKIQNRIRYLETDTRNGKISEIHEVTSKGFAYDFASSDWNDDDIKAFFKNLAYQEKKLNYSLVIEDWKKTLPIQSKVKLSDEIICKELKKMLKEEYDGEIDCTLTNTIALSESSDDEQMAIVFKSNTGEYNKEITFILSCIKIGKNLSIRIFTLFTPNPKNTTEQDLKEALTIKKGLNPKNTAYIEGLKESILETLEKYLKKETTINDIY